MKAPKEARRIARTLFHDSFSDGRLDEAKARRVVSLLVASKPRLLLPILKSFESFVRVEIERNSGLVESATPLDNAMRERILSQLQQVYHRPIATEFAVNEALIGGMRVRVGCDVRDGSIAGRLQQLSSAL